MRELLSGALCILALVAALHFHRFATKTRDRFFDLFGLAFAIFAVNSIALGLSEPNAETTLPLYVLRLFGFAIIVTAIWQKNRR